MYLSHKYKFLFLRTPKTASSSLSEFFIRNFADPDAIYTPVDDRTLRPTLDPSIIKKYRNGYQYFHLTLEDLVKEEVITPEQVNEYYCFTVLRDPIDRQKSFYYYYKAHKPRHKELPVSIEDYKTMAPQGWFIGEPNSRIEQSSLLKLSGVQKGEYWLYENINEHLEKFMKEKDISIKHPLSNLKSGFRKDREDLQFDYESITILRKVFENDFNLYSALKRKYNADTESLHP